MGNLLFRGLSVPSEFENVALHPLLGTSEGTKGSYKHNSYELQLRRWVYPPLNLIDVKHLPTSDEIGMQSARGQGLVGGGDSSWCSS